jgi:hypothetical protein
MHDGDMGKLYFLLYYDDGVAPADRENVTFTVTFVSDSASEVDINGTNSVTLSLMASNDDGVEGFVPFVSGTAADNRGHVLVSLSDATAQIASGDLQVKLHHTSGNSSGGNTAVPAAGPMSSTTS